ncbi:TPA: polysaccharide pyruvyl transferase family protein [Vibrio parahaemolyticus]
MLKKKKEYEFDFVIKGAYGTGNFGDDALFEVIYDKLPKGVEVAVIARDSEYLESNFENVKVFHPNSSVNIKCKYYIFGGGTQFYMFPNTNSLFYKINYHLRNPTYIIKKLLSLNLSVDYDNKIGIGLGLGPFYTRESKKFNRIINELNSFDKLYLRDKKSYDFCVDHNINKIELNTDLCFSKKFKLTSSLDKRKVAVILRDWKHDEFGKKHFKAIRDYLLINRECCDLILFSNDKYWIDFAIEHQLNYLVWDSTKYSSNEFIQKLAEYKLVISSRFHGIVYSTLLNIPAIAIEIEPKLKIGAELNTGLIWNGEFTLDNLEQLIKKLEINYDEYMQFLSEIRNSKYTQSLEMFENLKGRLG